jgi:hypothetical protein
MLSDSVDNTGKSRWSRRTTIIGAAVLVIVLMAMSAAVAVWISRQDTASQQFTSEAIGSVDIGDAEGQPLWTQDVSNLSAGDSVVQCVLVDTITDGTNGTMSKMFAASVADVDGLLPYLNITIETVNATSGTPGLESCPSETWASGYDGTLSGMATSYANGYEIRSVTGTQGSRLTHVRVTLELDAGTPSSAAGTSASAAFAFQAVDL